jgi:hypothetical protein
MVRLAANVVRTVHQTSQFAAFRVMNNGKRQSRALKPTHRSTEFGNLPRSARISRAGGSFTRAPADGRAFQGRERGLLASGIRRSAQALQSRISIEGEHLA